MKENGMNTLVELLNEYRTEKGERNLNESEVSQTLDSLNYLRLFIERLVENDKIKWRDKTELYYNISCYDWDGGEYELIGPDFTDTEQLIMILSIQDNPIEFLISILK